MQDIAAESQKALVTTRVLLSALEEKIPLPEVLLKTLEALIDQSGSRFAFLLHNFSGSLISVFTACDPESSADKEYLAAHTNDALSCLQPQLRRILPLIANSSTSVKAELNNATAWRLFQRVLLIPLSSVTGDQKGILALFGKPDNYSMQHIYSLEPLIAFTTSLLLVNEQNPDTKYPPTALPLVEPLEASHLEYAVPYFHSNEPRFITSADGIIIHYNTAGSNLLALPSEQLMGQPITRLIPKLKLNIHQADIEEFQELKALSKNGKLIAVRVSTDPFVQDSELLFAISVQDMRTEIENKTERHERAFRIQKQQRATLEVARIATQEEAPFEELVGDICHIASTTLGVARAGIWLVEEGTPVYRNIIQTDQSRPNYCESQPLILNNNATFVRQLEQVRVLGLTNLNTNQPNQSFLSLDYIQKNQTDTLICAAFIKNRNLIGFLMIESLHQVLWQEDQYNFVREVANYLHILVLNEHRQKIQSDLAQQEQQFRLLFFDSPLAMMAFDRETFQFIAVNHTATEVFGYSLAEMLNKGIYDLIPVHQVMDIHTLVSSSKEKQGNYHVFESSMQKHSGKAVDVEIHSHSINLSSRDAILMVVHDITEKKRIESSMRRTQKMEAVGQLVGGIAHDFNNITNIIRGHAELLEMKLTDNPKTTKHISAINKAAQRTTSLTHKLMQFSRQQQINSEVCHVGEVIIDLVELMAKSLTKNIQIILDIAPDTWPSVLDKGDFEDVMINLAINARDAMGGHGMLTISSANICLDAKNPLIVRDRQPGNYVCISIRDTGTGIPKELQEKIFDPFFTTKEKGKGTGLGLSMVYGFVKRSGGFLELESQEGSGTSFYLWLPRSELTKTATVEHDDLIPELNIRQGHTALVVDDEEDIRSSLSEILETIGFKVDQADSVAGAKNIILEHKKAFSLVISDIVMPGRENGVNLAQWIKEQHPSTRLILASGYAENISLIEARRASCELLKKPFGRQDLLRILSHWEWSSYE